MSAEHRTNVIIAWISVVGAIVTALGGITVAIIANRQSPPNHIEGSVKTTQGTTDIIDSDQSSLAVNITGTWEDDKGSQYDIVQNGSEYTFTAYGENRSFGAISWGGGTISGTRLLGEYKTNGANPYFSSGTVDSVISSDGRRISGTLYDREHGPISGSMHRK